MTLAGTRPPTVDEFEQYSAYHKKRLCQKSKCLVAAFPVLYKTGCWWIIWKAAIQTWIVHFKRDREFRNTRVKMQMKCCDFLENNATY